jgi:uncharacterized protein YcbK (DUF882 family)
MDREFSRRALIGSGAVCAMLAPAVALAPETAMAMARRESRTNASEHRIALRNVHTNERHDILFARGATPLDSGLDEIEHALRDWRTGATHRIDFALVLLASRLRDRLDVDARRPFDVISGYRSPATNGRLHAGSSGVATKSQHMVGKAIDLAIPGVPLASVHSAALALEGGGVGYYPDDGFVHIDTGPVRRWT